MLRDADFLESAHDIDSVFDDLRHGHLVAVQNAFDADFLFLAERVQLGSAHVTNFCLWNSSHAVHKCRICLPEFLQNWCVV